MFIHPIYLNVMKYMNISPKSMNRLCKNMLGFLGYDTFVKYLYFYKIRKSYYTKNYML